MKPLIVVFIILSYRTSLDKIIKVKIQIPIKILNKNNLNKFFIQNKHIILKTININNAVLSPDKVTKIKLKQNINKIITFLNGKFFFNNIKKIIKG